YYHPSERFGATGGINFKMYEDWRYFTNIDTGYFQVSYVKAYIPSIFMECFYLPAENSRFVGNITFTAPTSDDGKILPYYSPVQISVYYRHLWIKNFGTTAGLDYTGERYTDLANTSKIGGFVNVYIAADYKLFKDISVSCRLDNLTNSDIYIWNGYKERGIYFELGISWQF
ncbi:MAG: hypothetical protein QG635_626, partial [Bacteroidota bacterium]|nr:hypothetical protein [Bacteroidota bacterium]